MRKAHRDQTGEDQSNSDSQFPALLAKQFDSHTVQERQGEQADDARQKLERVIVEAEAGKPCQQRNQMHVNWLAAAIVRIKDMELTLRNAPGILDFLNMIDEHFSRDFMQMRKPKAGSEDHNQPQSQKNALVFRPLKAAECLQALARRCDWVPTRRRKDRCPEPGVDEP